MGNYFGAAFMRRYIVIDLDGTIADSRHREHYAVERDWDEFHLRSGQDAPKPDVRWLINFLSEHRVGDYPYLMILTGRNERYRPLTENWLRHNNIDYDELIMRPDNNFERDADLKLRLLQEFCDRAGYDDPTEAVIFILEEREGMVQAYREAGFPCWQVQAGGY